MTFNRSFNVMLLATVFALSGCSGSSSSGSSATPVTQSSSQPQTQPAPGPETLTRMVIGPGGGTLEAFGGAVKLDVPEGALTSDVDISVQPIATEFEGAVGWSYEFKPDGLTFQKPALLTLNLVNTDLENGTLENPATLALGYRDTNGRWRQAATDPVSQVGDQVIFEQAHFSQWAFYERWYLAAGADELQVNESVLLGAKFNECEEEGGQDCLLTPLEDNGKVIEWRVNGIVNGDAENGTLTVSEGGNGVTYTAPSTVPANNPVSISATIDTQSKGSLQLVHEITILSDNTWSGYVEVEFQGTFAEPYLNGQKQGSVRYRSHQDFASVLTESFDDEGGGLVMMMLGMPTLELQYEAVADDYYTGEDVDGCVRHQTITTTLNNVADNASPAGGYGSVQFNLAAGYATTPFLMPPPVMIAGSRASRIEGCGASEFSEDDLTQEMLALDTYQSALTSALSDDGKRYTATAEMPSSLTLDSVTIPGTMKFSWLLIRN